MTFVTTYLQTHRLPALIGFLALALAPHAGRLPVWIVLWCMAGWSYALLGEKYRWAPLARWIKLLITLAGLMAVVATYRYYMGREVGTALLALLLGIKPLEIVSRRDHMVTLFLSCFLILANLLFSQSLLMAAYLLLSAVTLQMLLMHTHQPDLTFTVIRRTSTSVVIQALPLMLISFMLFPRLPGALFRLTQEPQARSGLSQTMAPGDISRLIPDRRIALRANFTGAIPNPADRYWRAMVLWHFDGTAWHRGDSLRAEPQQVRSQGDFYYSLLLEPHQEYYGVALDIPVQVPAGAVLQRDQTVRLAARLTARNRFDFISVIPEPTGTLHSEELAAGLRLPVGRNPRSQALAQQWAHSLTPEEVVAAALNYFRREPFYYTLTPPLLAGSHRIDEFLFTQRRGYCEHYAAAMAVLMRAAGIPARIVTGYQGGALNPLGEFLTVRQSDAHAWVEVALPGQGWRRVDPTAAVAPERIELGMEAAIPAAEIELWRGYGYNGPGAELLAQLGLYRDAVNHFWHTRVLDYSYQRQQQLLTRLGLPTRHWREVFGRLLLLLIIAAAAFTAVLLWRYRPRPAPAEPARRLYLRFVGRLRKAGVAVRGGDGPCFLAAEVAARYPDAAGDVKAITQIYVRLRYGAQSRAGDLTRLKQLVRQFTFRNSNQERPYETSGRRH